MLNKLILSILLVFSSLSSDVGPAYRVELPSVENYVSPSCKFNALQPSHVIDRQLTKFGATYANKAMFQQMIENEAPGFFGYHAGSSDYRIFQDVIKVALEECLGVSVRSDFQFLRAPGLPDYPFQSADEFVASHPYYNDNLDHIKRHILSLNVALYNSYDAEWDFTPRYFLQNQPWTHVQFERELWPFFLALGVDCDRLHDIFRLARQYVPQNKGMILQFFDTSPSPYAFLNRQAFVGHSRGYIPHFIPSECYLGDSARFPQLRLVLNNQHMLNPNSPVMVLRYSTMPPEREAEYFEALREFIRTLPLDHAKAERFRDELLRYWYPF